ncbi:MAG: DUF4332 domain-containing protein [Cyanobacteria bacterium P01_A01_bin.105]
MENRPKPPLPLDALPGLPSALLQALQQLGIQTTQDLIHRGKSPADRLALARQVNSHPQHIHKWTALARLATLPSVGTAYCGLLLHAGISSPEQLALTSVQRLHPQLQRLHLRLLSQVNNCPGPAMINQWIQEARRTVKPSTVKHPTINRDTKTSP